MNREFVDRLLTCLYLAITFAPRTEGCESLAQRRSWKASSVVDGRRSV